MLTTITPPAPHKIIKLAETRLDIEGVEEFLNAIGASGWAWDPEKDAPVLTEIAGRLCYKSFEVGLNPNVTRIRAGNGEYCLNLLKQRHGSVLEHSSVSYALLNVSRILTHELVRHRAGCAYSQESQRFVRLDDFEVYYPDLDDPLRALAAYAAPEGEDPVKWANIKAMEYMDLFNEVIDHVKVDVAEFLKSIGLDNEGVPFHIKKEITSALRRIVPGGVLTNIILTANHRTWRHIIAARTAHGAEIEIRQVFYDIGMMHFHNYLPMYQDMSVVDKEGAGCPALDFKYDKV